MYFFGNISSHPTMTFFKGPCILAGSHAHIPRWLTSVWTQPQFSLDVGHWPSIANRWWEELRIFSLQGSDSSLQSKKMEFFLWIFYIWSIFVTLISSWSSTTSVDCGDKDPSDGTEPQNNSRHMDIAFCHRCVTPLSPPFLKVGTAGNENLLYQPTGFSNMSLHHRYGEDESNLHCLEADETALAHLAPFTTSKLA